MADRWEVLGHAGVAGEVVDAPHVLQAHLAHRIHIAAESPLDHLGVLPVVYDVADGGKGHVVAHGSAFLIGHVAQFVCVLRVGGGGDLDAAADVCAVRAGAVAAALRIAGDEEGDGRGLLQRVHHLPDPGGLDAVVPESADVVLGHNLPELLIRGGALVVYEQLSYLLLVAHPRDGLLHPGDVLLREAIGFCPQIYHANFSFRDEKSLALSDGFWYSKQSIYYLRIARSR